jgi:hypothetical protein
MLQFDLGPDPLRRLPALAARLGVQEWDGDAATVLFHTREGKRYCLFELINAFLDRLDKLDKLSAASQPAAAATPPSAFR